MLAVLRHRTFFTLADLNAAIGERLDAINERPMKVLGVSRRALFEQIDRPALRPLPRTRYELGEWVVCRPNIDYHVSVDYNFYSVPSQLAGESLEARVTASTVEVFLKSRRVAAHTRLTGRGHYATQVAHMPSAHRAHAEWTPSRLIAWAEQAGPATGRLVAGILERRPHPEQGYNRIVLCAGDDRRPLSSAYRRLSHLADQRGEQNLVTRRSCQGTDRVRARNPVAG